MEMVVPVDPSHQGNVPLATGGELTLRIITGADEAATYVYAGNADNINDNLVDLQRWLVEHGYKLSNMIRQVTLHGPFEQLPSQEWLTEIQYPLEKA